MPHCEHRGDDARLGLEPARASAGRKLTGALGPPATGFAQRRALTRGKRPVEPRPAPRYRRSSPTPQTSGRGRTMPIHIVKPGECFTKIAERYGFADYKALYDHPDNAELKKKRKNPNVLHPGDRIVIPERKEKTLEGLDTGKTHRFKLKRPKKALRLALLGHGGEPLKNEPYKLEVAGETIDGKTNGEGKLEHELPVAETTARLTIAGRVLDLRLGQLNPLDAPDQGVSGVQGRLANLGYHVGPADGIVGKRTRAALAVFQHDHGLEVTGKIDDATKKKLEEAHGC